MFQEKIKGEDLFNTTLFSAGVGRHNMWLLDNMTTVHHHTFEINFSTETHTLCIFMIRNNEMQ